MRLEGLIMRRAIECAVFYGATVFVVVVELPAARAPPLLPPFRHDVLAQHGNGGVAIGGRRGRAEEPLPELLDTVDHRGVIQVASFGVVAFH